MPISWPWKRGRTEAAHSYADVLIPLEEAYLHSHSARTGRTEFETRDDDDDGSDKDGDGEEERQGMLQMNAAEYTIEGLRKSTREGNRGIWTTYESENIRYRNGVMTLTQHSQVETRQQSRPGYRTREVPMAALRAMWLRMVRGQVSLALLDETLANQRPVSGSKYASLAP